MNAAPDMVDLILTGCGLMGGRHLHGYAELERVRPGALRLRAVCDPRGELAERAAADAEQVLGYRPTVCRASEEALARVPGLQAADVVTPPSTHPAVVLPLLEAGVHVQVEKPLSVTVADGQAMVAAAARAGRVLAVAENYRRDPMNRLLRHVIRSGSIGTPQFALHLSVSPGRKVVVSPWRHSTSEGGLGLDVGVHYADMLEYLLGPVESVAAVTQKACELREWSPVEGAAEEIATESDDVYAALLTFESGAPGVWVMHFGSAGERQWQRTVHGSAGMVAGPPDRSGQPVRLQRGSEALEGDALIAALPDFRLHGIESELFGRRPGSYQREFAEIDRQLIAIETADFLDAIRDQRPPEVSGEHGLRSVAVVTALLEAAKTSTSVSLADRL